MGPWRVHWMLDGPFVRGQQVQASRLLTSSGSAKNLYHYLNAAFGCRRTCRISYLSRRDDTKPARSLSDTPPFLPAVLLLYGVPPRYPLLSSSIDHRITVHETFSFPLLSARFFSSSAQTKTLVSCTLDNDDDNAEPVSPVHKLCLCT